MSITIARGKTDEVLESIRGAMNEYQRNHPSAEISLYRQNGVSVRIRVIDPEFQGVVKSARHTMVWDCLEKLPEEVQSDISMLVVLAPKELHSSISNLEFEDPSRSAIQ